MGSLSGGVVSTRLHLNSAAKLSEQPEPPL